MNNRYLASILWAASGAALILILAPASGAHAESASDLKPLKLVAPKSPTKKLKREEPLRLAKVKASNANQDMLEPVVPVPRKPKAAKAEAKTEKTEPAEKSAEASKSASSTSTPTSPPTSPDDELAPVAPPRKLDAVAKPAPAAAGDEPVIGVKKERPPREPVAPPWTSEDRLGFIEAIKAGGGGFIGGPLQGGGGLELELGWRAPFAHRLLGVSLAPSVLGSAGSLTINGFGNAQSSAFLISVPLLVTANIATNAGLWRVMAGPSFDAYFARTDFGVLQASQGAQVGVHAGLGYYFHTGPGGLGLEVRYRLTSVQTFTEPTRTHGVIAQIAYLFNQ